jgi:hypothetical protein
MFEHKHTHTDRVCGKVFFHFLQKNDMIKIFPQFPSCSLKFQWQDVTSKEIRYLCSLSWVFHFVFAEYLMALLPFRSIIDLVAEFRQGKSRCCGVCGRVEWKLIVLAVAESDA